MNSNSYQQSVQSTYAAPIFVQVVVVGIIIPVAEEMMFRGVSVSQIQRDKGLLLCGTVVIGFTFR